MALRRAASGRRPARRRATSAGRRFTYSATYGGAQLEGEPYTVAPGSEFSWFRSRVLGGRTNHYGRVTLRFADYDFKPKSTRRPRLRLADQLRGPRAVLRQGRDASSASPARSEGIRSAPDGIFKPPAPLRAHDVLVQRSCAKLGIRAIPARQAVTTVAAQRPPACHYCGQCGRGCRTGSNYASSYVQIFPAMQTGRVQVLANAMARELITDATRQGHRRVVHRQDDGQRAQVRCRTVVLAASACESARLLLNSKVVRGIRRASRTRPARSAGI